jgi:hypothetical protein
MKELRFYSLVLSWIEKTIRCLQVVCGLSNTQVVMQRLF